MAFYLLARDINKNYFIFFYSIDYNFFFFAYLSYSIFEEISHFSLICVNFILYVCNGFWVALFYAVICSACCMVNSHFVMYVLACKKHIKLLLLYLSKQYGDGFVLFLK